MKQKGTTENKAPKQASESLKYHLESQAWTYEQQWAKHRVMRKNRTQMEEKDKVIFKIENKYRGY